MSNENESLQAIAFKIINELDQIARDVCGYEYGLPNYDENTERMVAAIVDILKKELQVPLP